MTRLMTLLLLLVCVCGWAAGFRTDGSWGVGLRPGFAPIARAATVSAPAAPVAWNADPDCVIFDGSDDYAQAYRPLVGSGAFSVLLWLNDQNPSKSGFKSLFQWGNNTANALVYCAIYPSVFMLGHGGGAEYSTTATTTTGWRHLAFVHKSQSAAASNTIYIDGTLQPQGTVTSTGMVNILDSTINYITIGCGPLNANRANVKMAEIAFFNRELSQSEIAAYMPWKFTGSESGLVRLYHCDEGAGATMTESISGYDASLYNGATWSTKL